VEIQAMTAENKGQCDSIPDGNFLKELQIPEG